MTIKMREKFIQDLEVVIKISNLLSPSIDNSFYKELFNKLQYIEIFPKMYPTLMQNPIYRKFIVKKYIVLYEIKENEVILTHIIHEKSKFFNNQD